MSLEETRYQNQYHFLFRFRDGELVTLKEYMDTERVTDVLCGGQRRRSAAPVVACDRSGGSCDGRFRPIEALRERAAAPRGRTRMRRAQPDIAPDGDAPKCRSSWRNVMASATCPVQI